MQGSLRGFVFRCTIKIYYFCLGAVQIYGKMSGSVSSSSAVSSQLKGGSYRKMISQILLTTEAGKNIILT